MHGSLPNDSKPRPRGGFGLPRLIQPRARNFAVVLRQLRLARQLAAPIAAAGNQYGVAGLRLRQGEVNRGGAVWSVVGLVRPLEAIQQVVDPRERVRLLRTLAGQDR